MKRSEKQLPSKVKTVGKALELAKLSKKLSLGEIEAKKKKCFQRQSKYLTLTLIFAQYSALRERFDFCFSRAFC